MWYSEYPGKNEELTSVIIRENCPLVQPLHQSFSPLTKHNFPTSEEIKVPGQYTWQSETLPRVLTERWRRMPQCWLDIYLFQSLTTSQMKHAPCKATNSFTIACLLSPLVEAGKKGGWHYLCWWINSTSVSYPCRICGRFPRAVFGSVL